MRQRFESVQGVWTYWIEISLDAVKKRVVEECGQHTEEQAAGKPRLTSRSFDTYDAAAKYFRYALSNMTWKRVGGDDVALDPDEDFKSVKDKTADYRYYEHRERGLFWDIDRNDDVVEMWEGPIGERGTLTTETFDWAGEAKPFVKEQIAARKAQGFKQVSDAGAVFLAAMSAAFGELPDAYRRFIEEGTHERYKGWYASGLPGFSGDAKFKLRFDDSDVTDLDVPATRPALLPVCKLTDDERHCLAVDRGDPALPVWVVFQSDAPVQYAASFDVFLKSLFKRGVSPFKKLQKAYKQAETLRKKGHHAEALVAIEGPLAAFPPRKTPRDYFDESDDLRDVLAASYNLAGLCLRKADRRDEALMAFENAVRVTSIAVRQAPKLNLLDTVTYDVKDYARALRYAATLEASDAGPRFFLRKAVAFATLGKGDISAARERYNELREAIGEDKETRARCESVIRELQEELVETGSPSAEVASELQALFKSSGPRPRR